MHHSRAYSYDDQGGNLTGGHYSSGHMSNHQGQYTQQYTRGYHEPQGSGQYYVQAGSNADVIQPDPYFRSMTPMVSTHSQRYYQNGGGSSSPPAYPTPSPYYASQFPQRPQTPVIHAPDSGHGQFIPTPSELYAYTPRQVSVPPQSPTQDPYSSVPYSPPNVFAAPRSPEHRPSRISTGRPMTSPGSPIASPTGERFPCERCGKTFSRSHDRKRHHETQHLTSPVIHRCRYCEKEFSRADSLKRHLDNGCDEMPS